MSVTSAAFRAVACGAALVALPALLGAQQRDTTPARRDSVRRDTARAPAGPVAQPTVRRARATVSAVPASTARDPRYEPPIRPGRAFLRSFVAPGWGEFRLGRRKSGFAFAAIELGTLVWGAKAWRDLSDAKSLRGDSVQVGTGPNGQPILGPAVTEGLINARRLHFEDAVAVLIANHLMSGADAYVAAHLWDLPARVSVRARPRGATVVASIAW
jgi:hypothetical protein